MIKFIRVLSGVYAFCTLLILVLVARNFVVFVSSPYSGTAPFWVSVIVFVVLGSLSVSVSGVLSYLLAVRRHRKAAVFIAALTCVGIPIGTVLGGLTIYALTRPQVRSQFTPTI